MADFQNPPLSWSVSRSNFLHYCQKKYFFNYYWNWLREFDEWIRLDHLLLKNLKSMDMWIWEKTHNLISDYLNLVAENNELDKEKLLSDTISTMDQEYEFSKTREYQDYDKDNKFWLSEHYYNKNIDKEYQQATEKLKKQFYNFVNSKVHEEIISYMKSPNKRYIESKEPDFEKMKVTIDNISELQWVTIWAKPDFWVIVDNKKYIIYDWKAGKVPSYKEWEIPDQLKVYAYKLLLNLWTEKIDDIQVFVWEVYLEDMSIFGWEIKMQDIIDIQDKIIEDVELQKRFIQNWDPQKNIPKATHYFERTENKKKCQTCTFWKVCTDLKHYE